MFDLKVETDITASIAVNTIGMQCISDTSNNVC